MNNEDIGPPATTYKTQDCYQVNPESGVSFENGGGYMKVGEFACLDLFRTQRLRVNTLSLILLMCVISLMPFLFTLLSHLIFCCNP